MLKVMRQHSQSFIIYVMFGVLVFVFAVSFGPGSSSCGATKGDYAARVDGQTVGRQEFAMMLRRHLDYLRQSNAYGGALTQEIINKLGIRNQVIEQLIETKLLALEAERHGLSVGDDDLLRHLESRYGVTDVAYEDYAAWVNRTWKTSVTQFEQRVRGDIMAEKIATLVKNHVSIGTAELKETFVRDHDRAQIEYLRFDPTDADTHAPSDQAIATLITDEPEAIGERFAKDHLIYRTPKRVRARQILKKLGKNATDAMVGKARNALMELRKQISDGADFASLAKIASDDVATQNTGGDLGLIKRGQMPKPITDAIFELKVNDLTQPIRTAQGLHLLEVVAVVPPTTPKLEEVQNRVAAQILKDRANMTATVANATQMLAQLKKGASITKLSQTEDEKKEAPNKSKPTRFQSDWILKSQPALPRIGLNKHLHDAIFSATLESPWLSEPFSVGRYIYVVRLHDREVPDLTAFSKDQSDLKEQAVWKKRSKVYRAWIQHLRSAADIELNPALFGADALRG